MTLTPERRHALQDIGIVALSLAAAMALAWTSAVETLIASADGLKAAAAFVAGMFFTSVFTTAPAVVALGEIAQSGSVLATAALGALGAVIGDLLIFWLVRDKLSDHIARHLKDSVGWARFMLLVRARPFRWLSFFLGGLIIASPLPDEFGVSLMGFSKMDMRWFIPLSYAFNFIGILAIGEFAVAIG